VGAASISVQRLHFVPQTCMHDDADTWGQLAIWSLRG
jgi:hypothetical protein